MRTSNPPECCSTPSIASCKRDAGIPQTYYEILVQLSEAPDRALRMSHLADRRRSSRSRLSHAVDRLVERGWVERIDCPTDKRGQLATLTDTGFAALADAAPGHVAAVREFMIDRLTPEQISTSGDDRHLDHRGPGPGRA